MIRRSVEHPGSIPSTVKERAEWMTDRVKIDSHIVPGVENLSALRLKLLRVLQQHQDRRARCPSGASSVDGRGQRASLVECMPYRSETTGPSLRRED